MNQFVTNEKLKRRAQSNPTVLRGNRTKLFKAFDILKTNYAVGIDEITQERWAEIVRWYRDCLDLSPQGIPSAAEAIGNPPSEVTRYLPKKL